MGRSCWQTHREDYNEMKSSKTKHICKRKRLYKKARIETNAFAQWLITTILPYSTTACLEMRLPVLLWWVGLTYLPVKELRQAVFIQRIWGILAEFVLIQEQGSLPVPPITVCIIALPGPFVSGRYSSWCKRWIERPWSHTIQIHGVPSLCLQWGMFYTESKRLQGLENLSFLKTAKTLLGHVVSFGSQALS